MARNRIIYASQSVWVNGEVLYRVQSLGSTTTFTSEDIFELGHLDIVDVVDDVPSVAVTLNTNDFGDVKTFAVLAQVLPAKRVMDVSADTDNANLIVVDAAGEPIDDPGTRDHFYLHGCCLADFAVTCGSLPGVSLWAPVQEECSIGSLAENIDQTLYLDAVYVNSLEFAYSSGANATENYGAETDNKMWLLNDGRFVSQDSQLKAAEASFTITLVAPAVVATLSTGLGFLRKDDDGNAAVTWYNNQNNTVKNVIIKDSTDSPTTEMYSYNASTYTITYPTSGSNIPVSGDVIEVVYAADAYGDTADNTYFKMLQDTSRADSVGAVRQGQVEVCIVGEDDMTYETAWRLTSCTISADLTREPLSELGHLAPYDRPLTMPIPITVSVDSTAGDLHNWAKIADRSDELDAGDLDDLKLADLMSSTKLKLVVKIYGQTDEQAGGTDEARTIYPGSDLIDQSYWVDGLMFTYSEADREYPLKTIIVEHLKITDEGMTLDLGSNATQTFSFRSTNDLYAVKGAVSITNITGGNRVRRQG